MALGSQDIEKARERLGEIVGPDHVVAGGGLLAYSAFEERPVAAVFPGDEQEVAEIAHWANLERVPVVLWGGGTKQDVEPVQPREGIVLGTGRLNSLVELDAANLTATAGVGMVMDELQKELAKEKLFLPLDPVDSDRATVGGTLATNSSGSRRLLYRTARDWVLGLREVTPEGSPLRTGQKTVKDVAGYDLKKLWIGSWGTLGPITEATFRLLPLPESSATLVSVFPQVANGFETVSRLLASFLRPSSADLLREDAFRGSSYGGIQPRCGEYLLAVQVEGAWEAVDRQKREILALSTDQRARESAILEGEGEGQFWAKRRALFAQLPAETPGVLMKGSVPLTRQRDFAAGLAALGGQAGLAVSFACHAGNGVFYVAVTWGDGRAVELGEVADQVGRLGRDCGGFAVVQRAPRSMAVRANVWPPRSDYGTMRAIKAELDPKNLWNPARVPGGRA